MVLGDVVYGGEISKAALLGMCVACQLHGVSGREDPVVGKGGVVIFTGEENCADAKVRRAGW